MTQPSLLRRTFLGKFFYTEGQVVYAGAFCSAALTVLAFPPWDFTYLILIAWVPWRVTLAFFPRSDAKALQKISLRTAFLLGFLMSIGGFYWVAWALHRYGELPLMLGILGLVVFASFNQLQFFLTEWARFRRGGYTNPIFASAAGYAAIYTLIDRVFPKLFRDTFGHALYLSTSLRQWAEIGGAFLLTFAVVWFNLRITDAVVKNLKAKRFEWKTFLTPILGLVVAMGLGQLRYLEVETSTDRLPTSKVLVIQANIGDATKIASERGVSAALNFVVDTYDKMSKQAVTAHPDADALVWPETAFPTVFSTSPHSKSDRDQKVRSLVSEIQKPLLFGGYDQDDAGRDYNALYLLSRNGFEPAERYRKHILLLFGEELPFADRFPVFLKWFPQVGQFGKGPGPEILTYFNPAGKGIRVAPLICYEGLFPEFFKTAMVLKPDFFLNVTNDSWFGPWAEPQLHLSLITFRAIETRTAQLRSTNTGISGLLTPSGNWLQKTAIEVPVAEAYSVPLGEASPSLYKNLGEAPLWFILFLAMILPIYRKRKKS